MRYTAPNYIGHINKVELIKFGKEKWKLQDLSFRNFFRGVRYEEKKMEC